MTFYIFGFVYNKQINIKACNYYNSMYQSQNSTNNFDNTSSYQYSQNQNNYQLPNTHYPTYTNQNIFQKSQSKELNNSVDNRISHQNNLIQYADKQNTFLNSIIASETKQIQDPSKRLEIAKLFNIIYVTLKPQYIKNYFLTYSLIPSTDTQDVLLKKYSLFYQSYSRMSRTFIRQYQPYLSPEFRTDFYRSEMTKKLFRNFQWLSLFGLIYYGSNRMAYKWKILTISPRYQIRSLIFLFLLSQIGGKLNSNKFKRIMKKNISQFDSVVKTQEFILMNQIKKQIESSGKLNPPVVADLAPNQTFSNYQSAKSPFKNVY